MIWLSPFNIDKNYKRYIIVIADWQEGDSGYSMTKKTKGVLAVGLASSIALSMLTSCDAKTINKKTNVAVSSNYETINLVNETPESTEIHETESESLTTELKKENLIESEVDVFANLIRIYEASNLDYLDILEKFDRSDSLYVSSLYIKLRNSGLNDETIINELRNIAYLAPAYIDEGTRKWDLLFGNINNTLDRSVNAVEYYYPLAMYFHLSECGLKHENVMDSNRIYCDETDKHLMELNDGLLFVNYALEEINEWGSDIVKNQMNRLLRYDIDYVKAFEELDNMYLCGIIPTDYYDIWDELFHTLNTTVGRYENVYDYYYELACFVHQLKCDSEHTMNECGRMECEPYKLKYEL